ncbi:uncharacterized protein LOC118463831 isoform X2 [Anopheles albimanus]|uniref:uncharacterized protein LOC118463831 isoform X2 n=1 Tax=Anopheles albimanus TaxID=7167 RepID=UPI001640D1B1|nr:uncharacterized protein LOC118463831 isoform X2 [Anopheles albimanus]
MSSARCLNWSRPPPGRHPSTSSTTTAAAAAVLRKQVSCIERSPSGSLPLDAGQGSLLFSASGSNNTTGGHRPTTAHRGTSGSGSVTPLGYHHHQQQQQQPSASQRRRPASASAGGTAGGIAVSADPATTPASDPTRTRPGRRAILCKQLSLDQSILVAATAASSIASGMAAVASAAGDGQPDGSAIGERGWGFGRKQPSRIGTGAGGMKSELECASSKKGPKAGKDSRINIKIFLGQTVQQDSSDTGISDTEAPTPAATTSTSSTATAAASLQKSDSTPAMSSTMPAEPYSTFSVSKGSKAAIQASGTATSGRSSSLAQRRAQFQANRQNSEAHDRRHPPLVRAMSAPIRPADPDTSKFLQSKKKPRRRKVLREKDEYNICEEDEYSDEGGGNILSTSGSSNSSNSNGTLSTNGGGSAVKGSATSGTGALPLRSRSVLGGVACDIETLVSLLSSGGSDSEKEQEQQNTPQNTAVPPAFGHGTGSGVACPASLRQPFTSAHLKGRAPMLKKTGKSVSFQESDLKPAVVNAGLNRDYRKPPTFQPPTVASRVRRAVHTLNAFQLKDREKCEEKELNEEKCATDWLHREKDPPSPQDRSPPSAEQPTKQGAAGAGAGGKTTETTGKSSSAAVTGTNGELLQSPKEQECYRLYLKMSKKGLAVSYDTILRGMLTPTELRVLQKKKSRCQRADDGDGTKEDGLIGSEEDMVSPGENGPLASATSDPSLKEQELIFPLPCPTETNAAGGLVGIRAIPEEPSAFEHEIKASDSDVGGAIAAHVS